MAAALDVRALLDVYPEANHFTCVGTTKKGLRCGNSFIEHAYLDEASEILDELPAVITSPRRSAELLLKLRRLAYLTLCPLWHQSKLPQVEPVANRWSAIIRSAGTLMRPPYAPLTPPATPMLITRQLTNYSRTNFPASTVLTPARSPLPVTRQGSGHSTAYPSPPPTPPRFEQAMAPRNTTSSSNHQTRTHTSRAGRNVNISFNINVDSNQNIVEHGRHTHGNTPPSPTASTVSSRSSRASNSRSSSSSSSDDHRSIDASQAQAHAHRPRASRSSNRSLNPSSPAPSTISNLSSPRSLVRSRSSGSGESSLPASDDLDDSDFQPNSSDSDSDSDFRPGGATAHVRTPASSSRSSAITSPRSASQARSGAPSPSSAASAASVSVRRRPITADTFCYVCYDPIVRDADAAWCHGSCGQNVCLVCYATWIMTQTTAGEQITCGFCRAPWVF
ncbi:uncharacterized protein LY89DRAFT_687691 [Mollisia scopiformis]|uniref:RING-type domain-containing protein n=1 Tax=Mollisia scopiformis TaxID=149040 RepID=A0A194WYG4_MOLSC|nr:uncharacterized protein LY89DRAFT_687691 [Mollisia scopiformis]KUJ12729.1 hypothetical protein LY89DRAFT_687691 [Mollisia scopiformis]